MTHVEFAAWLKGVDEALNGEPPSAELWRRVVEEIGKVATPYTPVFPPPSPQPSDWWRQPPYVVSNG